MAKPLILAALLFSVAGGSRLAAIPYGAGDHDVSEYMIGSVVVNIIFPESTGSGENWTDGRKNDAVARIHVAMDWWAARQPNAQLSFAYNVRTESTAYEPITCNSDSTSLPATPCTEGDWVGDIMTNMGYSGADYFEQIYAYNNAMRTASGADWSFTIFIADSQADADGMFPDGFFAYTYMGGPFMVLTYDNGSYGVSGMSAVAAHETGHVFYALDEYTESGCTTSGRGGYLNAANLNCQNGGTSDNCIMRGQLEPFNTPAICASTRLMLGWRDTDVNGILDIVDLPPTTTLTPYAPDPSSDNTPTYSGVASSILAYHNSNTYEEPAMRAYYSTPPPIVDISVLKIAGAEYKVDAGAWQQASAQSAPFDQTVENFTFTPAAISNAAHTILARAKDNFGNYDPTPDSDSLTVNTGQPANISYVNDGTGDDIAYTRNTGSLSANWGASYYLGGNPNYYEYRIGTTSGGSEISGWTSVAVTSVTRSGLSLTEGSTYYFGVRAVGLPGPVYSGATVSNGQRVDLTSPTARVEISSPLPAKSGQLTLKLIVTEAGAMSGTPVLTFTPAGGSAQAVSLSYLANTSTWTGTGFIESWHSTGTAAFSFNGTDMAGNTGTSITAGATFLIDTSVSGITGGTVVNSDNDAVIVPPGAYSGNLFITISTIPASRTALADAARSGTHALRGSNLTRELTARTPAGVLVTRFTSPVTIKMSYPDSNSDGRIDGDYVDEGLSGLYLLDESASVWTRVDSPARNTAGNYLTAPVSHFSVYSVRVLDSAQSGMGSLKAFPSPCYFDRPPSVLTIRGLPMDAVRPEIDIYNSAGELVRVLKPGDGIDSLYNEGLWDGRQKSGAKAASGLYIYVAKTENYGKASGKFYIFW